MTKKVILSLVILLLGLAAAQEISFNEYNPLLQGNPGLLSGTVTDLENVYYRVDVPRDQLPDIKEYAFSFWYRWSQFAPEFTALDLLRGNWISLAGASENELGWAPADVHGQRTLAMFIYPQNSQDTLDNAKYTLTSYNLGNDNKNQAYTETLDDPDFDSVWNFIYFGYSTDKQELFYYIQGGATGEFKMQQVNTVKHLLPPPMLFFTVGAPSVYYLPPGYLFNVKFLWGKSNSVFMDTKVSIDSYMKNAVILPPQMNPDSRIETIIGNDSVAKKQGDSYYETSQIRYHHLGGALEYGLSGWAQWNFDTAKILDGTSLYRLTFNKASVADNANPWDRIFYLQINSDFNMYPMTNIIHLKAGADNYAWYPKITSNQNQLKNWFYFYQGYSHVLRKGVFYFRSVEGEQRWDYQTWYQVPKFIGIWAGRDKWSQPWNGNLANWYFRVGPGAFKQYQYDEQFTLGKDRNCALLFSECNFFGDAVEVCGETPTMDPNFLVQSIKIPQGKLLKLYNMEKLQGKSAVFKKSVQCLDKVEFSMFAQLGISLLEEGEELQQNVLEENKKFFLLKRD